MESNDRERQRRLAVFDFDGTLTLRDSLPEFIRHARGGMGMVGAFVRSLPKIASWKLGKSSNGEAKERLFAESFAGMELERFDALGRSFAARIDTMLRPETVAEMHAAHARGETVVVLSASIGNWLRPWAAANGVDRVIATEAEVDKKGRLTGRFATPNCHGREKIRRLEEAFPELKENRAAYRIAAWGDSPSDRPLLAYADTAVEI